LFCRYSAALALHGAHLAPYYLDEDSNWGLSVPHLREQVQKVGIPLHVSACKLKAF